MSYENEENKNDNLINEEEYIDDSKRKKTVRIIAIVTALCLVVMIMTPIFTNLNLPSLNFLKESSKLTQKPEVKEIQKSIATITVKNRKGTGFNIDENGLIVTNAHVVQNSDNVFVSFYKGKEFNGSVLKVYPDVDLALIKLDGEGLPKLELGKTSGINKEDEVLIVGNPLEYEGIANKGKVYGMSRVSGLDGPVLLIDAPINKGNSGSPVLDKEGKVIGIIFATINNKSDEKKLGVAIPIQYLLKQIEK